MWTYNEAAIELVAAIFIKRLQQHGHEFREENNLLVKEIHGNDKRYRLLVHLVLNGLFLKFYFIYLFFIASKTHTEKKQKLRRINKVIKQNETKKNINSEFTHLHGNILTNIKIRYSSANSIYYCT